MAEISPTPSDIELTTDRDFASLAADEFGVEVPEHDGVFVLLQKGSLKKRDVKVSGTIGCHSCTGSFGFEVECWWGSEGGGGHDFCCPTCSQRISLAQYRRKRDSAEYAVFFVAHPITERVGARLRPVQFSGLVVAEAGVSQEQSARGASPSTAGNKGEPPDHAHIRFACPKCGRAIRAPSSATGRTGKCPSCGCVLKVPSGKGTETTKPPEQGLKPHRSREEQEKLDEKLLDMVATGDLREVRRLLDAGADVNCCARGRTALIVATEYCQKDVTRLLLDRGATVSAHDPYRWSALHYAAKGSNHGKADENARVAIAEMLLQEGADVNDGSPGFTPVGLANEWGLSTVAAFLQQHGGKS